jgi:hypothetical protein
MSEKSEVHSYQIISALEKRFERDSYMLLTEVPTGGDVNGNLRFDAITLARYHNGFDVTGYEVKVSRSDFLRDAKLHLYPQYVNAMTLVCPRGMVDRKELPDGYGLMWYEPESGSLRYRRKPEHDLARDTHQIRDSIIARLAFGSAPSRYGRYEDAREYVQQKRELKNIGRLFGTMLAKRVDELSRATDTGYQERLERDYQKLRQLENILQDNGVDIYYLDLDNPEHVQRITDQIKNGASLQDVRRQSRSIVGSVNTLLRAAGLPQYQQPDSTTMEES